MSLAPGKPIQAAVNGARHSTCVTVLSQVVGFPPPSPWTPQSPGGLHGPVGGYGCVWALVLEAQAEYNPLGSLWDLLPKSWELGGTKRRDAATSEPTELPPAPPCLPGQDWLARSSFSSWKKGKLRHRAMGTQLGALHQALPWALAAWGALGPPFCPMARSSDHAMSLVLGCLRAVGSPAPWPAPGAPLVFCCLPGWLG